MVNGNLDYSELCHKLQIIFDFSILLEMGSDMDILQITSLLQLDSGSSLSMDSNRGPQNLPRRHLHIPHG